MKFDGYRMQARLDDGKVKLLTRKALDWTHKFKPVADAVAQLDADSALIDGEIVVEDETASAISPRCRTRSSTARRTASSTTCSTCCISTASI